MGGPASLSAMQVARRDFAHLPIVQLLASPLSSTCTSGSGQGVDRKLMVICYVSIGHHRAYHMAVDILWPLGIM